MIHCNDVTCRVTKKNRIIYINRCQCFILQTFLCTCIIKSFGHHLMAIQTSLEANPLENHCTIQQQLSEQSSGTSQLSLVRVSPSNSFFPAPGSSSSKCTHSFSLLFHLNLTPTYRTSELASLNASLLLSPHTRMLSLSLSGEKHYKREKLLVSNSQWRR